MEMKYVVPDMAQSFGTLEFAGESDQFITNSFSVKLVKVSSVF